VPVRLSPVEQGQRRGRQIVANLGRELEDGRLASGLSFADLGAAVGISGQQAARICHGQSPDVSFVRMGGLLAAVGLDLSSRAYPGSLPVRDAAHLALLRRFRSRLGRSIEWLAEAPVVDQTADHTGATAADRRAWDARISGPGWRAGVEAETRLGDVQALERRLSLKQRDGRMPIVVLVINDTAHNRMVLADPASGLRGQFPGSAREALRLLASGHTPRTSTIVVL
jgi:transcriptional regulator with XRE-family HTH domain